MTSHIVDMQPAEDLASVGSRFEAGIFGRFQWNDLSSRGPGKNDSYTLVMTNIAMENYQFIDLGKL